jgi:hypothetical protein
MTSLNTSKNLFKAFYMGCYNIKLLQLFVLRCALVLLFLMTISLYVNKVPK